ncbi:hypothetical protein LEMLEM_LOCUS19197 [Lemmus lemmus]
MAHLFLVCKMEACVLAERWHRAGLAFALHLQAELKRSILGTADCCLTQCLNRTAWCSRHHLRSVDKGTKVEVTCCHSPLESQHLKGQGDSPYHFLELLLLEFEAAGGEPDHLPAVVLRLANHMLDPVGSRPGPALYRGCLGGR